MGSDGRDRLGDAFVGGSCFAIGVLYLVIAAAVHTLAGGLSGFLLLGAELLALGFLLISLGFFVMSLAILSRTVSRLLRRAVSGVRP